ncbi:MAG TPA: hypothetical protein VMI31_18070 [Fimbriimonadaceae bacterium]|nr:hypothetical protein [Fimbriimonadaceae bacterium]
MRIIGLSAVAALSLTALALQDGVVLKRAPKLGDTAKYKLSAQMDFSGQDATVTATITDKVTKVADNGDFTVESSMTDTLVNMGGSDLQQPDERNSTLYSKANDVLSVSSDPEDPDGVRKANIQTLHFPDKPVKVGDSWTVTVKKNEKGAVDASGTYTIAGRETINGQDTFRIKGSMKETSGDNPMSADGTYWVNVKDASLVKLEGSVTNYPIPNAPVFVSMKMTLVRIN